LIQVIPFLTTKEPQYLSLLVRGLTDLTTLRLNNAQIDAQINVDLEIDNWQEKLSNLTIEEAYNAQELWVAGEIDGNEDTLLATIVLYDPAAEKIVYFDRFEAVKRDFLMAWEEHLRELLFYLNKNIAETAEDRPPLYTASMEAFLEFRKGLELLSEVKSYKQREEGLDCLLSAISYDPDFNEAIDILLLFIIQNGFSKYLDDSIAFLFRLRNIAPEHPRIPLIMAELNYQAGNIGAAEKLFGEVVTKFPNFIEGWLRLALFYHSRGQYDQALNCLQNIIDLEPDNATAMDLMGAVYAGMENYAKAEAIWLKALEIDPGRVNVYNNLGLLAEERGRIAEAEFFYQQGIQLNDRWWGSYYNYGAFCSRQRRLEEALDLLKKASVLNRLHFQTFILLGKTQLQLKLYDEAEASLLHLLQIAPDNSIRRQALQLLNKLNNDDVKIHLRLRGLEKSLETQNKWIILWQLLKMFAPANKLWYYWYLSGKVFEKFNLNFIGLGCWLLGMRFTPGYQLLKEIGIYYYHKGSLNKALPFLRKAYKLHKSDQEIIELYLQTLIDLGEIEEYEFNYKKLLYSGTGLSLPEN